MAAGESRDPYYHAQVDPITSDKRDRVIPNANVRRLQLLLDNARNEVEFKCEGDFLFADTDSTGSIKVRLNSTAEDQFPIQAQGGVIEIPMRNIYITHAAQAGKILNLWYGYRARFLAPAQSISSIGSILNPIDLTEDARKGDAIVRAGDVFSQIASVAPVAAQSSLIQLFNPGAGIVYVDRVQPIAGSVGTTLAFMFSNAALATDVGAGINNDSGAAAGVAHVRSATAAAIPGTEFYRIGMAVGPAVVPPVDFDPPIRLGPNEGLVIGDRTVNDSLALSFRWRERAG